jgi:hypothetical protein
MVPSAPAGRRPSPGGRAVARTLRHPASRERDHGAFREIIVPAMTAPHALETWESLERLLAEGEEVWVELHGTRGEVVFGTDRRLVVVSDDRISADWPWEEVDDVANIGGRGVIRVRRRDRSGALAIEPVGDRLEVMQAVTVLALLAVDAARYGARLEALRASETTVPPAR